MDDSEKIYANDSDMLFRWYRLLAEDVVVAATTVVVLMSWLGVLKLTVFSIFGAAMVGPFIHTIVAPKIETLSSLNSLIR
jgi:hypothetical protein